MNARRCRHAKRSERTRAFSGPVRQPQNRAAHGNVCIEETCSTCGAVRRTNINGAHRESSGWRVTPAE